MPGTDPIAEGPPSGYVRRETAVTRLSEDDPTPPGREVPPDVPRSGESLVAEEVPSGTPPRAPLGDVQRTNEDRTGHEEREEDKGLIDRAKDYLRGEDRERDYLRGEDRDRER